MRDRAMYQGLQELLVVEVTSVHEEIGAVNKADIKNKYRNSIFGLYKACLLYPSAHVCQCSLAAGAA